MSKARDIADLDTAELAGGAGSGLDADKLDGQQGAYYTAYADTAISNLVDSSPASLNTLNELAAALGDDVNFSTTVTDSIALKAPLASPTFTGTVTTAAISGTTGQFGTSLNVDGTATVDGLVSSGNVGVGDDTFAAGKLRVYDTAGNHIWLKGRVSDGNASVSFRNNADTAYNGRIATDDTSMNFQVNGSERMRIDGATGNVLVGTDQANPTSSGVNVAGQEFSTTGGVRSTVASNAAATFNRKTDDGGIVLFRKDGTTVGSIGSAGNGTELYIAGAGTNATGIYLANSGKIVPMKASAISDATQDIGMSSYRWKDLYLSGRAYINNGIKIDGGSGIYFGQDGSSANKLDDYEKGTWTPTVVAATGTQPSISYTHNTGSYTKVGRLVTLIGFIQINSISGTTTGNLNITGLPFVQLTGNGYGNTGSSTSSNTTFVRLDRGDISQYTSAALGFLTQTNGSTWGWERVNIFSAGASMRFSISYYTA